MNVPASDLWDLDWVHAAEEVPSWSDLTRSTWPLTPGTLNSDLQGTSTFVRGTLDGTYQEAKKKRKADALCSEGAQPKKAKKVKKEPAKFYCAQCPPEVPESSQKFQGSWGNGVNISPTEDPDLFSLGTRQNFRQAAFLHSCTGACQVLQRDKFKLSVARVSVHRISDPSVKRVILCQWSQYDIMKLRHDAMLLTKRGPVVAAVNQVGSQVIVTPVARP